jgi:hypothetical protein
LLLTVEIVSYVSYEATYLYSTPATSVVDPDAVPDPGPDPAPDPDPDPVPDPDPDPYYIY